MTFFIRLMHDIFGHKWEEIPTPELLPKWWGPRDPNRRLYKCKCGKYKAVY